MNDTAFRKLILDHWRRYGRHDLPWRLTTDPYQILVSEVMLQQTQVSRVLTKYDAFLRVFPTFRRLAAAPIKKVLQTWQGLGYNRRALMLRQCAQMVVAQHACTIPNDRIKLCALPGIGPYTAGAVLAFTFNVPVPMIETNIRRVYLHHYFPRRTEVSDKDILKIIIRHLSLVISPREWYWALMDYGAKLGRESKKFEGGMPNIVNPNRRSKQYTRQSTFEGSDRQIRGKILKELLTEKRINQGALVKKLDTELERAKKILASLEREGFIIRCRHAWCVHNPHWSLHDR